MTAKATSYKVFFDTNGLRGEKFITDGLLESMTDTKKNKLVRVEYLLPEIVKNEWISNYLNKAKHQYLKLENAQNAFEEMKITGHNLKLPELDDLKAMAETYLTKMGFKFIPTPYDAISFPELMDKAINHELPFGEDGDKGIKDAVIGLTIQHHIHSNPKKNDIYVLITKDGNFTDYINELVQKPAQIMILPSMKQVQSHIELEANNLSQDLSKDALNLLFERDVDESLWYKESIGKRLNLYYDKHFPDAELAVKYIEKIGGDHLYMSSLNIFGKDVNYSFGKLNLRFGDTLFEDRSGQTLHWSVPLNYRKEYLVERGGNALMMQTEKLSHLTIFEIKWSTKLNAKLELEKPKLKSIKPIKESKTKEILDRGYSGNNLIGTTPLASTLAGTKFGTGELQTGILSALTNLKEPSSDHSGALAKLFSKPAAKDKHFWDSDEEDILI